MTPQTRPEGCCAASPVHERLPARERRRLVGVFHALGDATRLEIFRLIASQPLPVCACDVVASFELRQPTISHHLKVLRDAGLVTATKRGVWSYYAVDPDGVDAARAALDAAQPEAGRSRS